MNCDLIVFNLTFPNITRKQETAITQPWIGQTHITHQHLVKIKDPQFASITTPLTILTECRSYKKERKDTGLPDHFTDALNPDPRNVKYIIEFIQNIYNQHVINIYLMQKPYINIYNKVRPMAISAVVFVCFNKKKKNLQIN